MEAIRRSNQALVAEAKRWIGGALGGLGDAGQVGGEKVRVYRGNSVSHSFKGYAAARERFGSDYGQSLADARAGESPSRSGICGLVGEIKRNGSTVMLAEAFDLSTGDCVAVSQSFRKSLLRKKPLGPTEVSTPDPLPYRPDSPEQKARFKWLREMAEERISSRHNELADAGARFDTLLTRRGGDRNMWDFVLIPCWGPEQGSDWKGVQVWEEETSMTTDEAFVAYIEARIAIALAGPPSA